MELRGPQPPRMRRQHRLRRGGDGPYRRREGRSRRREGPNRRQHWRPRRRGGWNRTRGGERHPTQERPYRRQEGRHRLLPWSPPLPALPIPLLRPSWGASPAQAGVERRRPPLPRRPRRRGVPRQVGWRAHRAQHEGVGRAVCPSPQPVRLWQRRGPPPRRHRRGGGRQPLLQTRPQMEPRQSRQRLPRLQRRSTGVPRGRGLPPSTPPPPPLYQRVPPDAPAGVLRLRPPPTGQRLPLGGTPAGSTGHPAPAARAAPGLATPPRARGAPARPGRAGRG